MRVAFASAFFNPAGFRRPARNFAAFLAHMAGHGGVHVVEQVLPGRASELAAFPQEGGSLTVLRGGAVAWQKERMLNHLLPGLLAAHDAVCWLDGDLLFPDPDLRGRVAHALAASDLVQLFGHSFRTTADWADRYLAGEAPPLAGRAIPGHVRGHRGLGLPADRCDVGLAWGATAEWLRRAGGLFDCGVLGGGDTFLLHAAAGGDPPGVTPAFDRAWAAYRKNARGARVGHVPGGAVHLHHGAAGNRRYADRYDIARRHAFDPGRDLRREGGLWAWAADKPGLHAEVQEYFAGRLEDAPGD